MNQEVIEFAKWVLGGGGVTFTVFVMRHLIISAPERAAATSKSDAARITDLQSRVGSLETIVAQLQRSLSRTVRERDALSFANDATAAELRLSAEMHAKRDVPPVTLIEKWRGVLSSHEIIEALPEEDETK